MARRDFIHEAVRKALEKDGWIVTHDPLIIEIDEGERSLEIDLGAERVIAAQKGNQMIAVEVKSFASPSILNSFHLALGQYLACKDALEEGRIDREMFLAIPFEVYKRIEDINFIGRRILKYGLKIIVIDIEEQKIKLWRDQ